MDDNLLDKLMEYGGLALLAGYIKCVNNCSDERAYEIAYAIDDAVEDLVYNHTDDDEMEE